MKASANGKEFAIDRRQIKAARALLEWSGDELAIASKIPKRTLARLEIGEGQPRHATFEAVRQALEAAGVEFIPSNGGGPGVRLKENPT